jgi:signal transduction histidine kinase
MMRLGRQLLRVAARPQLPRRTIRLRLTALYGSLFVFSSAALLVITNVLVRSATKGGSCHTAPASAVICLIPRPHGARPLIISATRLLNGRSRSGHGVASRRVSELTLLANSGSATALHHLLVYSGLALAIMAVLSVALGWLVAGRVLSPLRTITTTARSISATSLHERLALSGPDDELRELGDTFDDLLGRLEHFVQAQRLFVANASHELRTPLALQRTLIQLALSDPEADLTSLRVAHQRVLESGEQQERLIESLLTLAKGQAGLAEREPFDLASLADRVLLAREAQARDRSIELHADLGAAPTSGDQHLMERLIANLADNALSYNSAPGRIEVTTATRAERAVLSVVNTGPVVDPAAAGRLTQPFQRLPSERAARGEGSGLGLSIVAAIAEAHGGTLSIRPLAGGGLAVEVAVPGRDLAGDDRSYDEVRSAGRVSR